MALLSALSGSDVAGPLEDGQAAYERNENAKALQLLRHWRIKATPKRSTPWVCFAAATRIHPWLATRRMP